MLATAASALFSSAVSLQALLLAQLIHAFLYMDLSRHDTATIPFVQALTHSSRLYFCLATKPFRFGSRERKFSVRSEAFCCLIIKAQDRWPKFFQPPGESEADLTKSLTFGR